MGNCGSEPKTLDESSKLLPPAPPPPPKQELTHVHPSPPLVVKDSDTLPAKPPDSLEADLFRPSEASNTERPEPDSNIEDLLFPPPAPVNDSSLELRSSSTAEQPASDQDSSLELQSSSTAEQRTSDQVLPTTDAATQPGASDSAPQQEPEPETNDRDFFELNVFKFKELQKATQGFKDPDMVLGEGGFGKVYKGWLKEVSSSETYPVAVKRLNSESFQGQQEWLAEIIVLGKLRHPNLVRLIGYSSDQGEGLLVYEFLSLGSLDYHLFREGVAGAERPPLPWERRVQIALQAAQGLTYLHDNGVIHRDFKAPNILLDENYTAKIADFGLAKGAPEGQTHITTRIMGTMGYLDPKYMETGQLTKKSDVYAFGVLLLELLTGRRAVMDTAEEDSVTLAKWAAPLLQTRRPDIGSLIDPSIKDTVQSKQAQKAVHKFAISARHCIEKDPNSRPHMGDLVDTLRPLLKPLQLQGSGLSGNFAWEAGSGALEPVTAVEKAGLQE
eukprot:TRINITY_DN19487_c0_g2_i1.p1 TRINITY_DN19487_c0_g2~~TRINITY_DN19487_c0_g2_i1.p1  ORF type:complete len:500 (+),score=70.50 TRINITY_DN19487_c0_g2_i1:388-1887(+)